MNPSTDRLYQLLPAVHRLRDAGSGHALQGLLRIIAEQVDVVERDIDGLYENWFIETCQDWAVPYIGDLIGYLPQSDVSKSDERILVPRAEVANTLRFRRRKGTLALLEQLAAAVAGWPAHAVEFYRLLGVDQNINHLRLDRGRTCDLRDGDALDDLNGPFDELGHTVDVRRINSRRTRGRYNIPSVGVFAWRLKVYSVTYTPAYCFEEEAANCYHFSVLGNDTPLYTLPAADALNLKLSLPVPIRRRSFNALETGEAKEMEQSGVPFYYGPDKSLAIWTGTPPQLVPADQIAPADLSDWTYRPLPSKLAAPENVKVAVDPELGRMLFLSPASRKQGVWVSYQYGFSADIGGGEYDRPIAQAPGAKLYLVGEAEAYTRLNDALAQWQKDQPVHAVVEITDSGVYVEQIVIELKKGQSLQLRAANRRRPVIRLLDWQTSLPDNLSITGEENTWFTLDGLLVTGRGMQIDGKVAGVMIRHSTLVPGWGLHCNCEPRRTEASLELADAPDCLSIEHSILGPIHVSRDEAKEDPVRIRLSDSILDATDAANLALGATAEGLCAHAVLEIVRCTVIGEILTHAIELAENSIFTSHVLACRSQQGCFRFCYVPAGSRTPRRYHCQPDLAVQAVAEQKLSPADQEALQADEQLRVVPQFTSIRYGTPAYCQLACECADEIKQGADDHSEMGAFHDLYQPQRLANLQRRLDEYTPAGMDTGILFAN